MTFYKLLLKKGFDYQAYPIIDMGKYGNLFVLSLNIYIIGCYFWSTYFNTFST